MLINIRSREQILILILLLIRCILLNHNSEKLHVIRYISGYEIVMLVFPLYRRLFDNVWIGLQYNDRLCACTSESTCQTCRALWQWVDGSPMSYSNWRQLKPTGYGCGFLTTTGWSDMSCRRDMYYLCEKGRLLRSRTHLRLYNM